MNALAIRPFFPALIFFLLWTAAWLLMIIAGKPLITWLKSLKGMKWSPREDTPDSHLQKAGVPSMGGIGIIGSALASFIAVMLVCVVLQVVAPALGSVFRPADVPGIIFAPLIVGLHCALGLMDDWSKARGQGGLLARQKLAGQIGLAFCFLIGASLLGFPLYGSVGSVHPSLVMQIATFVFLALVVIAASNAVNLTDGIDGLAAGLSVQVGLAFLAVFLIQFAGPHDATFNAYNPPVAVCAPLFWLGLSGACFGFLNFNKNPAKVFMGDTGSLALGAALGVTAILTRSVFLLPFIGFIFWIEMFSVVSQVAYFKTTKKKYGEGRRIFRRAPLHHHFELGGWSEWKVVGTFWAINLLTTVVGLVLWKMGILPRFP